MFMKSAGRQPFGFFIIGGLAFLQQQSALKSRFAISLPFVTILINIYV